MTRRFWLLTALLTAPLAVCGSLVYAHALKTSDGYTCPLTGEQLPCPRCCPLNKAKTETKAATEPKQEASFICPLTGEELPCPNCCPLNQQK